MTKQTIHHHGERAPIERETFLTGRDVLDRIRSLLDRLGDVLADESERASSPDSSSVFEILERERSLILTKTLSDFEQTTPTATTQRMHQYSTPLPSSMLQPPTSASPDALAAWTSATIDRFGTAFDELASGCESDRLAEPFQLIATRMRAHARRMSRISTEALETAYAPRRHPARAEQRENQA